MGALHVEVAIERPVDVVWAYLADPRHDVEWQQGVMGSTHRPEGPIRVGTRKYRIRDTPIGEQMFEIEITHVDHAGREWRDLVTTGSVRGSTGHYRVVPYGQASRVVVDVDTRGAGLARLVMPWIDRSSRRDLAGGLARLKAVLEGRPSR